MLQLRAAAIQGERVGFGRRDLGRGARHIELGDVAGAPAPLGERERFTVGHQRALHQRALGVERPQVEIGLGDIGLHQQPRALQQPLARLRVEQRGLARVRQAPEQVDLVGQVGAGDEQVARRAGVAADDAARAGRAHAHADLRCALRVGRTHQGVGLREARCGDPHAGVALVGAFDQVVEDRIVERLPPLAARLRLGRRGHGPLLLELRRRRLRQLVGGDLGQRGGAAGKEQEHEKWGQTPFSCGLC